MTRAASPLTGNTTHMDQKLLRKLNNRLAVEFGRNPHGGNNYLWIRTDDDRATLEQP